MPCVYSIYAHSLIAWTSPDSEMANQGMVILQMGDNHDNENHEALPQQPPSLAQAIAALIADRNKQTGLIRQLVQAQVNADRGRHAPPPPAETDYVIDPPYFCRSSQLLRCKGGFVHFRAIEDAELVLNGANPSISLKRIIGLMEQRWLGGQKTDIVSFCWC